VQFLIGGLRLLREFLRRRGVIARLRPAAALLIFYQQLQQVSSSEFSASAVCAGHACYAQPFRRKDLRAGYLAERISARMAGLRDK